MDPLRFDYFELVAANHQMLIYLNPQIRTVIFFENLKALGFNQEVVLNHTGVYGNYLQELRDDADLKQPLMSQQGLDVAYNGFDGSPIYNDGELFKRWLHNRTTSDVKKSVTFFNLITLHDGNHLLGKTKTAPYGDRAKKLFDQLDEFLSNLEKSGKRYMVVVVPEHGAALPEVINYRCPDYVIYQCLISRMFQLEFDSLI